MTIHKAGPGKLYLIRPDGSYEFLAEVDSWEFTFVKPGSSRVEDSGSSSGA